MIYDVRAEKTTEVSEIVFADKFDDTYNCQASFIRSSSSRGVPFLIIDDGEESVIINSVEHANNLKKALDKAIELGWIV